MNNTLLMLEKEAKEFMNKRINVENRIKNELISQLTKIAREIEMMFKSFDNISISYMSTIIENNIRPLVNQYKVSQKKLMEDAIINNFEEGYKGASKFFQLATGETILISENIPEIEDENTKEEILLLLLLYSEKLIDSLNEDFINNLEKDLTNIYITTRNKDRDKNNIGNNILTGAVIAEYINVTLNNITNRADTISRTEINRALNHGSLFFYTLAENIYKGLLVKWVEIPDRRLCRFCKEKAESGTRYGVGVYNIHDIQPPPLHPNCRCVLVPYHEAWS